MATFKLTYKELKMRVFGTSTVVESKKHVEVVDGDNTLVFNVDSLGRIKLVESKSTTNCSYMELRKLVAKHRPLIKEQLC